MSSEFPDNTWVKIVGLGKKASLNNKCGRVVGKADEGRLAVELHDKVLMKTETIIRYENFELIREYMANPRKISIQPVNLIVIPETQLTALVRASCDGERRNPRWEEVQFPNSHPIFQRQPNCPIPKEVGVALILTKIASDGLHDHSYSANLPCVLLRCDVKSGDALKLTPTGWDWSDVDHIGPAYVCLPGGTANWRVADAERMHAYLTFLTEECYEYGDHEGKSTSPSVNNFREWVGENYRQVGHERDHGEVVLKKLLIKAHVGDAKGFREVLRSQEFLRDPSVINRRGEGKGRSAATPLMGAYYGGNGEIIGAILSHEHFDRTVLKGDFIECVEELEEHGRTSKVGRARTLLFFYNLWLENPKPSVGDIRKQAASLFPTTKIQIDAVDALEIGQLVDFEYPFPKEEMEEWMEEGGHNNREQDDLRVDMELLQKLWYYAMKDWLDDKDEEAEKINAIGWILHFRGGIHAMNNNHTAFQVAAVCHGPFFDMTGCQLVEKVARIWDKVGNWIAKDKISKLKDNVNLAFS